MAQEDIYGNNKLYLNLLALLPSYVVAAEQKKTSFSKTKAEYFGLLQKGDFEVNRDAQASKAQLKHRKYEIQNPTNLMYFARLAVKMEAKNLSAVRKLRYLRNLIALCNYTRKDLVEIQREDIDSLKIKLDKHNQSVESQKDAIKAIKYIWRQLFPETDEKGRIDETITPYPVRHLTAKVDKSKEKKRGDRISWQDFENLLQYFQEDKRMQAYLMLALESLGRPQEILFTRIKHIEHFEGYCRIHIDEHGKEGTGYLQCIDSYPYLLHWLEIHPQSRDKNAFIFCNIAPNKNCEQLTPPNINKKLRIACKHLKINKITCYSLKRNGVTLRRLRGESDAEIQHAARWTSTKQLKIYDQSDADDALKRQLARRGLLKEKVYENLLPKEKNCAYCGTSNTFHASLCHNCKRPLDRDKIKKSTEEQEIQMLAMQRNIELLQENMKQIQDILKKQAIREIAR